jgi:hypothetical protein
VIVVDSSVWIDFFNGVSTPEVERLDRLLGVTPLVVGDLILVDVVQGFRHERDVATACLEAKLPLLFSDRDFLPYVNHLGLEAA